MKKTTIKKMIALGLGAAVISINVNAHAAINCATIKSQQQGSSTLAPYFPAFYSLTAYCTYKKCLSGGATWTALAQIPGYNEGYTQCSGNSSNASTFNLGKRIYCIFTKSSPLAKNGEVKLYAEWGDAPSGSGTYNGSGNDLLYKKPITISIPSGGFISSAQMQSECTLATQEFKRLANGYYNQYYNKPNKPNKPKCRKSSIFLNPGCM